ncbi:sugar phosphate nucleotidyltransferase [Patescibacteria group bacterium]|nr:sugar phosphate nucleotidyltransferase [Patescibacteria group bacterium]
MKGVVLAGGLGTRLYPLTYATNKHLLPIYNKPMVFYPLETLLRADISEILVVVGGPHAGHFIQVLRNGKQLGVKHLEFAYQEKEGGIAQALALAEDFADGESIAAILGDNTTDVDISEQVKSFEDGAMVFLKEVPDPERFGVPVFDKEDSKKIMAIEEKPKKPQSNFAVTGLYLYDNKVFSHIKTLFRSDRGELEITDVNNCYLREGKLRWAKLDGFWSDAGTFKTLYLASRYWAEKVEK